ncbi:MAG: putative lipopolysaccharide heptosyltransferase III [Deltaproteobacteria bacterium]|nr:putative lipopolysaccharide heptosyltransferase III [Deltaproteobacteria bacterium]
MFKDVKKILVIKLRHIGDVLLTVPALRALKGGITPLSASGKTSYGGTTPPSVSVLVNSGTEEMLTGNPLVDEVIPFKRGIKGEGGDTPLGIAGRVSGELSFVREIRKRSFDMTVDLTGGDRAAIIGFLSGARYRVGCALDCRGFAGKRLLYTHLAKRPDKRTHTALRDLGVVREFGFDTPDLSVDIYTSAEDDVYVDGVLKNAGIAAGAGFVHAHPTSRWLFKCWTDEGMAHVLDAIQKTGMRVVITTGPAEPEVKKARAIISRMKTAPVDLTGAFKLKHLACLSRRATLFFGVDSAPMHIAAATGARVVSIFGPSGAFDWGPWDNDGARTWKRPPEANSPYPSRNGVQRFGKNVVIQKDWDCIPCGHDGCDGSKKSRCLDELDKDLALGAVMAAIEKIVNRDRES